MRARTHASAGRFEMPESGQCRGWRDLSRKEVGFANVAVFDCRMGSMSDEHGRVTLKGVPAGRRTIRTMVICCHPRPDTVVVRVGRCDSLRISVLRYKHVKSDHDLIECWD